MVEIRAGICVICKDIIYSRSQHDCISCSCGACFIDGGSYILGAKSSSGYIRTKGEQIPTTVKLMEFEYVYEAKKALYNDWNTSADMYGRISN